MVSPGLHSVKGMIALKGLGLGAKTDLQVAQLKACNLDWFYTWGNSCNLAVPQEGIPEFVPMIWGKSSVTAGVAKIRADVAAGIKYEAVLGFNEPDHASQANMSEWDAIGLWDEVGVLADDGLRIASPSMVTPNGTWIDEFIRGTNQWRKRTDIIAVHSYMNPDAKVFVDKIRALYERTRRPIWITEMGVADWNATATVPNRYSREQVNDFMAEVVPLLRAMPYVERFAWKTRAADDPVMGTGALFNLDGSLTSTGQLYASL